MEVAEWSHAAIVAGAVPAALPAAGAVAMNVAGAFIVNAAHAAGRLRSGFSSPRGRLER